MRTLLMGMAVGLSLVMIVMLATFVIIKSDDQRNDLCANQHAIIEMQRLFLAEHAAIREDLRSAGIPAEHADPDLLDRLAVLIERAECIPSR